MGSLCERNSVQGINDTSEMYGVLCGDAWVRDESGVKVFIQFYVQIPKQYLYRNYVILTL